MKEKKPIERTCVACHQTLEKKSLIRIVKTPDGEIKLDFTGKLNGRGAYICNNAECLKTLKKKNLLSKAFKMNVPEEVYDQLIRELDESANG